MAAPVSFLSTSAKKLNLAAAKQREQNTGRVLSVSGAPMGEVGRNARLLLLREGMCNIQSTAQLDLQGSS